MEHADLEILQWLADAGVIQKGGPGSGPRPGWKQKAADRLRKVAARAEKAANNRTSIKNPVDGGVSSGTALYMGRADMRALAEHARATADALENPSDPEFGHLIGNVMAETGDKTAEMMDRHPDTFEQTWGDGFNQGRHSARGAGENVSQVIREAAGIPNVATPWPRNSVETAQAHQAVSDALLAHAAEARAAGDELMAQNLGVAALAHAEAAVAHDSLPSASAYDENAYTATLRANDMTSQALQGRYPVDRFDFIKGGPGSGPHSNGGSHYGDHWPKPKMWGNGGRRPMTGLPKGPNVPDPKLHGTPNPYTKYVPSDRSAHGDQGTGRTVKFEGSEIVKGGPGSGRHTDSRNTAKDLAEGSKFHYMSARLGGSVKDHSAMHYGHAYIADQHRELAQQAYAAGMADLGDAHTDAADAHDAASADHDAVVQALELGSSSLGMLQQEAEIASGRASGASGEAARLDALADSSVAKGGPGSGRHPEDGAEASSTEDLTASGHRPLGIIAREIRNDWGRQGKGVYFGAKPYLDAMSQLSDIKDRYGMDGAKSIVAYFLSNASTWKGEKAKAIKAELKKIMNTKGVSW